MATRTKPIKNFFKQQSKFPPRNASDNTPYDPPFNNDDDNKLGPQVPFNILGLQVQFPFTPYNIQKAMMNKLVLTLTNKEHSLIESPTGTGKTLVLLCSALEWRSKSKSIGRPFISPRFQKKLLEQRLDSLKLKPCTCGRRPDMCSLEKTEKTDKNKKGSKKVIELEGDDEVANYKANAKKMKISISPDNSNLQAKPINASLEIINIADDIDWSDWTPDSTQPNSAQCDIKKLDLHQFKVEENTVENKSKPLKEKQEEEVEIVYEATKTTARLGWDENIRTESKKASICDECLAIETENEYLNLVIQNNKEADDLFFESTQLDTRVPRIFYGTRTHKQITQVIRELNKTVYCKNINMTILSSRDRTCINDDVKDLPNRNDLCKELAANGKQKGNKILKTCPYYVSVADVNKQIYLELDKKFYHKAWDIEDASNFGKSTCSCPYFGVRSLMTDASVTFCPYNYLLDPTIRKALDINLKNSVIIFDEAHNIEDICRDSASFTITSKNIDEMLNKIEILRNQLLPGKMFDALLYFRSFFSDMKTWMIMQKFQENPESDKFEKQKILFSDAERDNLLLDLNMTTKDLEMLTSQKTVLVGSDEEEGDKKKDNEFEEPTVLDGQIGQFISQLIITLTYMYSGEKKFLSDFKAVLTKGLEQQQYRKNMITQSGKTDEIYVWEFSLFCLNSAVSFEKVKKDAWSVIVASGTLSPIESLKTELGVKFEHSFEGSHVISPERIFASIISTGQKNTELNCSWAKINSLQVQDEIGSIIRDTCKIVPNGILCFFPSYDRMESLFKRWNYMNIIKDIKRCGKSVHRETKDTSAEAFEHELEIYRENARGTGAILFAVFRGKVSEGIDFSDEDARAVITIGIPYPHFKDVNVNLKRDYNDTKARSGTGKLMNGRDWYSAQAFRALNQALGRCIRHKDDWGAILMIDSRLLQGRTTESISKWIRNNIQHRRNYDETYKALQDFVKKRTQNS